MFTKVSTPTSGMGFPKKKDLHGSCIATQKHQKMLHIPTYSTSTGILDVEPGPAIFFLSLVLIILSDGFRLLSKTGGCFPSKPSSPPTSRDLARHESISLSVYPLNLKSLITSSYTTSTSTAASVSRSSSYSYAN